MENKKINLKEKFTKINEYWSPRVITEMNNYHTTGHVDTIMVNNGIYDDNIDNLKLLLKPFYLHDCWGLIERFGDYTKKHNHGCSLFSGVLYLNNHSQKLYFPEIKEEVTPTTGGFVLFNSFLTHYTQRNITHKEKYAISFNFHENL